MRGTARSTLGTQPKGNILLHHPDHYPGGLLGKRHERGRACFIVRPPFK
jgi:hypothetical protein